MTALLAALVLAPPTVNSLFDAALAAQTSSQMADVSVVVESKLGNKLSINRLRIAYAKPTTLRMTIDESGPAPSHRTYYVSGTRLVAYDRDANEVLRRKIGIKGTLLERTIAALGNIGDAAQTVIDPQVAASLYRRFRATGGWAVRPSGPATIATRADAKSTTIFGFDRRTHLLRRFAIATKKGYVRWTFTYRPAPAKVSFAAPSGARPVGSFTIRGVPPKYADVAAKRVATACLAAYDRASSLEFEVDSGALRAHVWMAGMRAREVRRGFEWRYDGARLWATDGRRVWAGKASVGKSAAVLNALGCTPDAYVVQLLRRQNPLRQMLVPGCRVRTEGSITLHGAPCDILEIAAPTLRISVAIRRSDHLIAQAISENLDAQGNKLAGTQRSIRYVSIGRPLAPSLFAPPKGGGKPKALPRVR